MMLGFFDSLKKRIRLDEVNIDNAVFKLHYKATAILLMAAALVTASVQYIGDPIDCHAKNDLIDEYCWIHSTNIIEERLTATREEAVAPGMGSLDNKNWNLIEQKYYQWMALFLTLQFIMFNATRKIWKSWEGGKLESLVGDLKSPIISEDKCIQDLASYFHTYKNMYDRYYHLFSFCEVLNFFHVIGQIYLMDLFLGGKFLQYGAKYMDYMQQEDKVGLVDPRIELFPTITRCTFYFSGTSSTFQKEQVLCLLPVNIVNEKIAVCLWFWFILLALLSGLAVLYSLACFLSSTLRALLLKRKSGSYASELDRYVKNASVGDWFIIYKMAGAMDYFHYQLFLKTLLVNQ